MNPYLTRLRNQYEAIKTGIENVQTRAANENRDMTEAELRTVSEQNDIAKGLYTQIEMLTESETRNAAVGKLAVEVSEDKGQVRNVGGAKTQDRDPGFYTSGSQYSFIGDQYRAAALNDTEAKERLAKHSNALRDNAQMRDVLGSGGGIGLVPPVWLAEQFAPVKHQKLRVASVLRQVPFAGPFSWSIPISGTAATTAEVAEGTNPTESNPTYSVLTVTPKTISGFSEVSRQMLEAANPAVDAVIWGDLLGDFYDDCEAAVIAALEAQASVNTVTIADGAVLPGARNGVLDAIAAISDNGGGDADLFVGRTSRWTQYLKLADSTNRPLIVSQRYNPVNAGGNGDALNGFRSPIQGTLEGLDVVTSATVAANRAFVVNSQEVLYSNSNPMNFRFDEPSGPALIRIGVWGYMAVVTGRYPKAITKVTYTAN